MIIITSLLLLASCLIEGTLPLFPLTLIVLLLYTVQTQTTSVFTVAFMAGLVLDLASGRMLGESSLFFTVFLAAMLLYNRKYELVSLPFVMVAAAVGSLLFFLLFGYSNIPLQVGLSVGIATLLFLVSKNL